MFNPVPVVAIHEFPVCTAELGDDGRPTFRSDRATLVEDMRIRWGRSDVYGTIEPSTIEFVMFDPTGLWLNRVLGQAAVGHNVAVWWDVPEHVPADPDLPVRIWIPFSGFITAVDVQAWTADTVDGRVDGWRIEVTGADRRVALGNVLAPWENWPAERMIDRAVRLRNWSREPSGIREFYYEAPYREAPVSPIEIRDSTALDLFGELYESFGQQWTYNPHRNVCIRTPRHISTTGIWLFKVDPGPYVFAAAGTFQDTTGEEAAQDQAYYHAATLDACDVTGGVFLHSDQMDDINRLEATWKPRPGTDGFTTVMMPAGAETQPPWRTLSFDSWLSDGLDLDPVLASVANKTVHEGRGPHHPPVTFDTGRVGGFRNVAQAMALTLPAEVIRTVVLTGSPWNALLGRPPVHAIIGGEIIYGGGDWTITANLATHDAEPEDDTPVPWNELYDGIRWGDAGHDQWRLAAGLSWADIRWIADGTVYQDWG